jgi:hypothetical protein
MRPGKAGQKPVLRDPQPAQKKKKKKKPAVEPKKEPGQMQRTSEEIGVNFSIGTSFCSVSIFFLTFFSLSDTRIVDRAPLLEDGDDAAASTLSFLRLTELWVVLILVDFFPTLGIILVVLEILGLDISPESSAERFGRSFCLAFSPDADDAGAVSVLGVSGAFSTFGGSAFVGRGSSPEDDSERDPDDEEEDSSAEDMVLEGKDCLTNRTRLSNLISERRRKFSSRFCEGGEKNSLGD